MEIFHNKSSISHTCARIGFSQWLKLTPSFTNINTIITVNVWFGLNTLVLWGDGDEIDGSGEPNSRFCRKSEKMIRGSAVPIFFLPFKYLFQRRNKMKGYSSQNSDPKEIAEWCQSVVFSRPLALHCCYPLDFLVLKKSGTRWGQLGELPKIPI